jgi:hypothetical protein
MRGSTVLSLPLLLVFPALAHLLKLIATAKYKSLMRHGHQAYPSYFAAATKTKIFYSEVNCTNLPIML